MGTGLMRWEQWRLIPLSSVSIPGKVSGGFAELELGIWKIMADSSGRRAHPNTNEPATAGVPLGGP